MVESSAVGNVGATSIIPQTGSGGGGGRAGGRSGGRCGQPGNAGRQRSVVLSSAASVVVDVDVASPHHQRKKKGFKVGDTCFTDVGGAFRPGIIIQIPANRGPKYYRIKLWCHDASGGEDEDQEIVAQQGFVFHPDDEVPAMSKHDRRTQQQQEISPWRTSRAKNYFEQRLLDEDDDSIHSKSEDHILDS